MPNFQSLWNWLTTDALGITIFGTIVATIILAVLQYFFHLPSRMWNWLKSIYRRARAPQPRYDLTIFEVYTDPTQLLPAFITPPMIARWPTIKFLTSAETLAMTYKPNCAKR